MTNQHKTTLRPATLDDVETLAALSHRTILVKYPDVIGREKVEGYVASGAVPAYYRDRNDACVVAEQEGVVVGVYALKENTVDLMMVALECHRSGVGSLLLSAAEQQLFEQHQKISLDSFRDNLQARQFYEKHGWKIESDFHDTENDIAMLRFAKHRT